MILEAATGYPRRDLDACLPEVAERLGYFRDGGFLLLDITPDHAAAVDRLPLLHKDPFDRLLVAQALSEPLRLVTHDPKVAAYSDSIIVF